MAPLHRLLRRGSPPPDDTPLAFSWVLTNQLALGPLPRNAAHWQRLEQAGLRRRFSCCYPEEEQLTQIPEHWSSTGLPLPDHRQQEPLQPDRLRAALDAAQSQLQSNSPLYLHCWAGIERSPLLAVGLTARVRQVDIYTALDWVRRCHPKAAPIYPHLEILEEVLR